MQEIWKFFKDFTHLPFSGTTLGSADLATLFENVLASSTKKKSSSALYHCTSSFQKISLLHMWFTAAINASGAGCEQCAAILFNISNQWAAEIQYCCATRHPETLFLYWSDDHSLYLWHSVLPPAGTRTSMTGLRQTFIRKSVQVHFSCIGRLSLPPIQQPWKKNTKNI